LLALPSALRHLRVAGLAHANSRTRTRTTTQASQAYRLYIYIYIYTNKYISGVSPRIYPRTPSPEIMTYPGIRRHIRRILPIILLP